MRYRGIRSESIHSPHRMKMQPPRGALLWRSLRLYQVYGANTDVGKTIFSTILCKGVKKRNEEVAFLKPISTGPRSESDQRCKLDPHILLVRRQGSRSDLCNRRADPVDSGHRRDIERYLTREL
jgi:hypothetical protein